MKPLLLVRILAFLLFAAGAQAVPLVLSANLSGLNENPQNNSAGTGWTVVTYDPDAQTLRIQVSFAGLTGMTTAAHIHAPAAPGVNAGVATQLPSFMGFPTGVQAGSYDHTFDLTVASSFNPSYVTNNGGTLASAEAALGMALATGNAYLNIHTNVFPGGELRGNLTVPDTTSAALLLTPAFLALMAFSRRRRVN